MGQAVEAAIITVREQRESMAEQLKKQGFIANDEFGQAFLTAKGIRKLRERMERIPSQEHLLIEIATCDTYGIQARI